MRTYEEVISELEGNSIFPIDSNFFKYPNSNHPLKKQFENLFRFGQDFLDRTDLGFTTDKARVFFSDRDDLNGYATHLNGYYLIDIYRGTIEKLDAYYLSRVDVFSNTRFNFLKSILLRIGIEPKAFFIQFTSLLYFYHETTHFIQQYNEHDKKLPFTDEQKIQIKTPIKLLREFDADWYGSAHSAVNVGERTENESEFIELAIMSLAAFFLFWVERSDIKNFEIFHKENKHPHPLIRLCIWIMSLTLTAKSVFGYHLDGKLMLNSALKVAALLENENENSKSLQMQEMIESKYGEILDYILQIQDSSIHYPYLANNSR